MVVYSGRNEALVGPLLEEMKKDIGVDISVRYGNTAELAATILEEGKNSPADVYFAQDAGALGALAKAGILATLPQDLLDKVDQRFRSKDGLWIGTSARARVLAYNTETVDPATLPNTVEALVDPNGPASSAGRHRTPPSRPSSPPSACSRAMTPPATGSKA